MWELIPSFSAHFTERFKIQPNTRNGPIGYEPFFFICLFLPFFKWNSVLRVTISIQNQKLNSCESPTFFPQHPTQTKGLRPPPDMPPAFMATPLKIRNVNRCFKTSHYKRSITQKKKRKKKKNTTGRESKRPDQAQTVKQWQEQPFRQGQKNIKQPGNEYDIS